MCVHCFVLQECVKAPWVTSLSTIYHLAHQCSDIISLRGETVKDVWVAKSPESSPSSRGRSVSSLHLGASGAGSMETEIWGQLQPRTAASGGGLGWGQAYGGWPGGWGKLLLTPHQFPPTTLTQVPQDLHLNFLHSQTGRDSMCVTQGSGLPNNSRDTKVISLLGRLLVSL